ncbi:CENPB DNA-binding domain-containing protein 1 [Portunus trituberculatus]|uniref:CENPB DNA-binding domain-containing protein 1 n=1 Tax=Portunus trituberculatus TaxID=210409 RepID=A0A5B7H229_PORTR|nr:CENPB DNA-binding domain-containing protein 1 [Portunus trituberculatus]
MKTVDLHQILAQNYTFAQSIVSTVIKQTASVKKAGETASMLMAKALTRKRKPVMEEMEKFLRLWFDDQAYC